MTRKIHGQAAIVHADKIAIMDSLVRRKNKHRGSRVVADDGVTIEVTKQHPSFSYSDEYPAPGTVISGEHAEIDTRMVVSEKPLPDGKRKKLKVDRGFDATISRKSILRRSRK